MCLSTSFHISKYKIPLFPGVAGNGLDGSSVIYLSLTLLSQSVQNYPRVVSE